MAAFNPSEFGINMDRESFIDLMAEEFNGIYHAQWTVDEFLLHPQEAIRFCGDVRRKYHFYDLPDTVILRVILNRRKSPYEGTIV